MQRGTMGGKNGLFAVVFLVAGVMLVAIAVPVLLSGVGEVPQVSLVVPLPATAIVVNSFILIEPIPAAIGLILLVVGVWVLRLSVKALRIDTSHKADIPTLQDHPW